MANQLIATLGALTSSATGTVSLTGTVNKTLGVLSAVGVGEMGNMIWPASLPQVVDVNGYEEIPPPVMWETTTEGGLKKRRRRFTRAPRPMSVTLVLTMAELEIFDAWFNDTLQGGALAFEWVHPRTREAATFAFTGTTPVKYSARSGVSFTLTMSLEIQ